MLNDSSELWQYFLRRGTSMDSYTGWLIAVTNRSFVVHAYVLDYSRTLQSDDNPKAIYVSIYSDVKRMEIWNRLDHENWLGGYMQHPHTHWRRRLAAPSLRGPMPPLFAPFRDASWLLRPPHLSGLTSDEDLGLPFGFGFDSLCPGFN